MEQQVHSIRRSFGGSGGADVTDVESLGKGLGKEQFIFPTERNVIEYLCSICHLFNFLVSCNELVVRRSFIKYSGHDLRPLSFYLFCRDSEFL